MTTQEVIARRAVESLRSGVPSRAVVNRLGTTQTAVRDAFDERLAQVSAGEPTTPLVLSANFGDGKSHLLEYLQDYAARAGFVTAFLVVSPEMALGRPDVVLKALAEAAEAPGRTGKALRAMCSDWRPDERYTALRESLETRTDEARFAALLHLFQEFRADEELRQAILDDVEGKSMKLTDIRRRLRELGQADLYPVARSSDRLLAPGRLRLYAGLCRAVTGHGLVVLFDEVERLARFTRRQRFAAYQQVGWWATLAATAGSGVLPVMAMTRGLVENTILDGRTPDEQHYRVVAADLPAEERKLGEAGLKLLSTASMRLERADGEDLARIRYRVQELYGEAYQVATSDPGPDPPGQLTLRSRIRSWITRWDLARYDPSYRPEIEAGQVVFDEQEIADALLDDGLEPGED